MSDVERAAADIAAALAAGNVPHACDLFNDAVQGRHSRLLDLCKRLGATVDVPAGTVVWGSGIQVWGNPGRHDHAWRCGSCPWTGSGYSTPHGAQRAAGKHAGEHDPALELLHLRPAVTS